MLCPICKTKTTVEETRGTRRRRVCLRRHSFHTVELVESHWLPAMRAIKAREVLREKGYLKD